MNGGLLFFGGLALLLILAVLLFVIGATNLINIFKK